ncbi:hypothetical protein [Nautilia sp.]
MKKFLIILSGFLLGVIVFLPKEELFYLLQKKLYEKQIYIKSDVTSSLKEIRINNAKIYYNDIKMADLKKAKAYMFIFYNKIHLTDLKLDIGNYAIKKAEITYSITNPLKIEIKAVSNVADINGYADLSKRFVKIYFTNIKKADIEKLLKKDKKGYFYYAAY